MKHKRILALLLAAVTCLSLAVPASAASTTARKATDFHDFDRTAWYADAVTAAVDNGLLYGKSATSLDPNGDMTRAEMAAIINRSFGCYKAADITQYKDVSKSKWYYNDVALAVQMGTYNGRSNSSMAPDAPITRQEAMTVVARALELDSGAYKDTELSKFTDARDVSDWALPYVRNMVGAGYIHGRNDLLAPQDNITRAEFAQIFANIIGAYITEKGSYEKDFKGNILIRCADVTLKDMTVDGDLIIGCGAADGTVTLDNVTVTGRLLVWGGGTKAVYCNNGTNMPEVVVARVDDAVKVIYDRDSTLAVIDTIKTRITKRASAFRETEIIFYDVSGLREAQKQLNAIVTDSQIAVTAPAHLYALVGEQSVKAEFINKSQNDTYKIEIKRNKDGSLIANPFEIAAGKSVLGLTLLDVPEYAYGRGETYTLELGSDLSRAIGSEFSLLASAQTVPLFLKKYQQHRLKQYRRREPVHKGMGDIICCLDESGSTRGDAAAWGKAVALTLLEVAAENRRKFALIHFSGSSSCKVDVFLPGQYSIQDKLDAAETFLGGGTDFKRPLHEALQLMELGFEQADIVFLTDGLCELQESYMDTLRKEQADRKFTITGILLDAESPGMDFDLTPFCQRIYRTSELGGDEIMRNIITQRI